MNITFAILLIITALGTFVYWFDFFKSGHVIVIKEDWHLKFEKAFPVADGWMAICALISAWGLLSGSNYGSVFALISAGSLIFLALMDITFNVQNGLYRKFSASTKMNVAVIINSWALFLGIALILKYGVWANESLNI